MKKDLWKGNQNQQPKTVNGKEKTENPDNKTTKKQKKSMKQTTHRTKKGATNQAAKQSKSNQINLQLQPI